ncbi:MAG: hypothetical protein K0A99_09420 [Desulfoarculaceae bacterium]|nr:hypothetical protein [Desulfoarculaceae bacterium]
MDRKFWSKIAISTVILGLAMFAFNTFGTAPDLTSILLPPVQPSATAQELQDTVVLVGFEMEVPEKGHVARAAFAIDNSSDHDIKNVEILCTLLDATGAEQGRNKWVIYNTLKAHTTGVFSHTKKMYVSDRVSSSQCRIVDMKRVTSPLIAVHRGDAQEQGR